MQIYYPALVASAIFFASILVNILEKNNAEALYTSLLAIPSITFMVFLSQKNLDILAYALILTPILVVYIGYTMGITTNIISTTVPVKKPVGSSTKAVGSSTKASPVVAGSSSLPPFAAAPPTTPTTPAPTTPATIGTPAA